MSDTPNHGWIPISEAPLAVMGFVWQRAWRSPFPGMRNGDMGAVWIDTCGPSPIGYQTYADWWKPFMHTPERDIAQENERAGLDENPAKDRGNPARLSGPPSQQEGNQG